MKLEKVIIDGKEYYRVIEENEEVTKKAAEAKSDSAETNTNEAKSESRESNTDEAKSDSAESNTNEAKSESTESNTESAKSESTESNNDGTRGESSKFEGRRNGKIKKDTQEFFERFGSGAKDFGVKIVDGAKVLGNRISVGAKDLGAKIKEGTERLFNKDKSVDPNSTEAKLLRLLPYMTHEDTHEFCEKILESDEAMSKINVAEIMPFVSSEDCDALFLKSIELDGENCDIAKAVPYVSSACLTAVVDGYIKGEYPDLNIDLFYPFLADAEIKKIFYFFLSTSE